MMIILVIMTSKYKTNMRIKIIKNKLYNKIKLIRKLKANVPFVKIN